jgi:hypothetical protein
MGRVGLVSDVLSRNWSPKASAEFVGPLLIARAPNEYEDPNGPESSWFDSTCNERIGTRDKGHFVC